MDNGYKDVEKNFKKPESKDKPLNNNKQKEVVRRHPAVADIELGVKHISNHRKQ